MKRFPTVLQRPRFWLWSYVAWFGALFILSSLPGSGVAFHPFEGFDKVEHAGYFFGGSLILGLWLAARGDWPRRWWALPLAAALVGAFDEWHQQFSPGRSALNAADWLADFAGGLAGMGCLFLFQRRLRSRQV